MNKRAVSNTHTQELEWRPSNLCVPEKKDKKRDREDEGTTASSKVHILIIVQVSRCVPHIMSCFISERERVEKQKAVKRRKPNPVSFLFCVFYFLSAVEKPRADALTCGLFFGSMVLLRSGKAPMSRRRRRAQTNGGEN